MHVRGSDGANQQISTAGPLFGQMLERIVLARNDRVRCFRFVEPLSRFLAQFSALPQELARNRTQFFRMAAQIGQQPPSPLFAALSHRNVVLRLVSKQTLQARGRRS